MDDVPNEGKKAQEGPCSLPIMGHEHETRRPPFFLLFLFSFLSFLLPLQYLLSAPVVAIVAQLCSIRV